MGRLRLLDFCAIGALSAVAHSLGAPMWVGLVFVAVWTRTSRWEDCSDLDRLRGEVRELRGLVMELIEKSEAP